MAAVGPAGGPKGARNLHGEKRRNDTHASTTDLEASLCRTIASTTARSATPGTADGTSFSVDRRCPAHRRRQLRGARDRDAVEAASHGASAHHRSRERLPRTRGFVADVRQLGFLPHVAPNTRVFAIDGRTTRDADHAVSQRIRKRFEQPLRLDHRRAGDSSAIEAQNETGPDSS